MADVAEVAELYQQWNQTVYCPPEPWAFRPGDLMFFEDPYSAVLSEDELRRRCSTCFRSVPPLKFLTCEMCQTVIYCCYGCQVRDKFHPFECNLINGGSTADGARLAARVMYRKFSEAASGTLTSHWFFGVDRTIADLEPNEEEFRDVQDPCLEIEAKGIHYSLPQLAEQSILDALRLVRINGIDIYDSQSTLTKKIGLGVYLAASKRQQTCHKLIDKYIQHFSGPRLLITANAFYDVKVSTDIKMNHVTIEKSVALRRRETVRACVCDRCFQEAQLCLPDVPEKIVDFVDGSPKNLKQYMREAEVYLAELDSGQYAKNNFYTTSMQQALQKIYHDREDFVLASYHGLLALRGWLTFEPAKQNLCLLFQDVREVLRLDGELLTLSEVHRRLLKYWFWDTEIHKNFLRTVLSQNGRLEKILKDFEEIVSQTSSSSPIFQELNRF